MGCAATGSRESGLEVRATAKKLNGTTAEERLKRRAATHFIWVGEEFTGGRERATRESKYARMQWCKDFRGGRRRRGIVCGEQPCFAQ